MSEPLRERLEEAWPLAVIQVQGGKDIRLEALGAYLRTLETRLERVEKELFGGHG